MNRIFNYDILVVSIHYFKKAGSRILSCVNSFSAEHNALIRMERKLTEIFKLPKYFYFISFTMYKNEIIEVTTVCGT